MRKPWAVYWMEIATQVATRATCDRAHVGCVLVSPENILLATGYNGSPRGLQHCDDIGHLMVDGHCRRTLHAERNAIAQAARKGVAIEGSVAYVTHYPCDDCAMLLHNAGVVAVRYGAAYGPPQWRLHLPLNVEQVGVGAVRGG